MIARHLSIHGRVQGVFYRGWAVQTARSLGLTGWVRNRNDGRLEILIVGESDESDALIDKLREGPAMARVDNIEAHADSERPPKGFTKRFTA